MTQLAEPRTITVSDWTEFGIWDRIPPGLNYRTQCPECTPHRKPQNQRDRDFVIAPNGEVGVCHHCHVRVNIRTRGEGAPAPPPPSPVNTPLQHPSVSVEGPKAPPPTPDTIPSAKSEWEPYLKERGLDADHIANEFGVRYIYRGDMGATMVIPQYDPDTGEVINHKYRGINKDFRNDPGTRRVMYNIHNVIGADTIVIVEGEMDVFAFEQAGFPHVISVPDGAPAPGAQNFANAFKYLEEAIPVLEDADRIILAIDNDEPGHFLRKELEHRIGVGTCSHIHFPEDVKDANDALLKLGASWLKQQVHSARPEPTSGIFTPEDSWTAIEHALKYGFDTGKRIGFRDLDRIYRPTLGHLTILTGHASSGKSTVLDNFVVKLTLGGGWPISFFSPEQMPIMRHLFGLAEIWVGKPAVTHRAKEFQTEPMTRKEIRNFIDLINPYISHISPEMADDIPSLDRILELATAEVRRIGIKGLIIDPWNEIEAGRPTHVSETEWVSIALGKIRRWARKHNVHVWLVAHPKKMRTEDGVDAVPGLGDISGSNNFRNKADYGLTVHKQPGTILIPGQTSVSDVIVTKARWKDSALANAKATFIYNPATNRIETPPHSYVSQVQQAPQQAEWGMDG